MSDEVKTVVQKNKRCIVCPSCQTDIRIVLKTTVEDVVIASEITAAAGPRFTEKEQQILDSFVGTELQRAFLNATKIAKQRAGMPSNIEKFFLTWLKSATAKTISRALMQQLRELFPASRIEVWGANGVIGILADGNLRLFVPQHFVEGSPIRNLGGSVQGRTTPDGVWLQEWIKTRHGYIAGRGAYFQEMKRRTYGDFATINL